MVRRADEKCEPSASLGVRYDLGMHQLERDLAARGDVLSDIDRAHATRLEEPLDAIALREQVPGADLADIDHSVTGY